MPASPCSFIHISTVLRVTSQAPFWTTLSPISPSIYQLTTPTHFTGLDAAEKKFGQGKVDPEKQRGMNEKITDQARGLFEKATGYAGSPLALFLLPFPSCAVG